MVWQSLLGPYIFVMLCQTLAAAVFSYCSFMALSTSGFVCKWNAALLQKQSQCGIFHFLIFQNLFTDLGNSPSVLWCAKELPLGMRLNTDCNTLYFWHHSSAFVTSPANYTESHACPCITLPSLFTQEM